MQVIAGCDLIRNHHVRLDDALTEPTTPEPEEENRSAQP